MVLSALKVSSCLASHLDAFSTFDFSAHLDVRIKNLFQSAQQLFAVQNVSNIFS